MSCFKIYFQFPSQETYLFAFSFRNRSLKTFLEKLDGSELVTGFSEAKTGFSVEDISCHPEEQHLIKSLVNEAEYVGCRLSTDVRVPANIHREEYFQFWSKELQPNDYLLDIIKNGYREEIG